MKIIIPDDYQDMVDRLSCFSLLAGHDVVRYREPAADMDQLVERLHPAEVIVAIRERVNFSRTLIERLPNLRLIALVGRAATTIDYAACKDHNVLVSTGASNSPTAPAELTVALIVAARRNIALEAERMRRGDWPCTLSHRLAGSTLGIFGLGAIGSIVAKAGAGMGMKVLAWGQETSARKAKDAGYDFAASKEDLFERSDVLSLHVRLRPDTRGIVGPGELARMKPTSLLVNTSRAELIQPGALLAGLQVGRPGYAAVDVYEKEPITNGNHPFLSMPNVLCVPHLGWAEWDNFELYFRECFEQIVAYAQGAPMRLAVRALMATETIAQTAFRKIIWRLMPLLTISYILNYLDRGNIGFAALQMNHQLGLSPAQFGFGAGILSLGYCTFEIPSNLALYRFGARKWIARIMITWGFVAAGCALIHGPASFYSIRFLLGVTEAGFFPGIAFLLSQWFPAEYRARMLAILLLGVPVSSVVGGPVSGALLGLDQIGGLAGWQWMFIIEGLPTVVLGFVVLWALADSPGTASWLTPEEKAAVQAQIAAEPRHKPVAHFWAALKDPRVLILALIQFGFTTGSYGVGIWLPQIIKSHFHSNLTVGFVSAGPYVIASIAMLVWAGLVDRSGKRIGNLMLTCGLATVGLVLSVVFGAFWLSFFWLTVALVGITAARAVFWAVPARFLTGVAAAGGLAFINSIGTIGGFVGPAAVGWLKSTTGSFSAGLIGMAGFLLLSAVLAAALRLFVPRE